MPDTDEVFHLANEATVTLRTLADRLRTGADPAMVAAQADADADTLLRALAATREQD